MLSESILVLGAMEPWVTRLMVAMFLVVCIAMILIVLIQRPQGGGLGGAFGAGGGSGGAGQTAFGTKTGDVLTWATIGIFLLFLGFAIFLNFATRPPEAADPTPTLVAPGTPRETVDDEQSADDDSVIEDGAETVDEIVDDAVEQIEETIDPQSDPTEDPDAEPVAQPSDG